MNRLLLGIAMVPVAFVALFLLLFAGGPELGATTTSCTNNTTATGEVSAAQIAAAAYAAGVRNSNSDGSPDAAHNTLTIVVALTMPESGANASAVQQGQPYATTGWGAWQVTPGDSEPQCGIDRALLNLAANACAMAAKLKAQGLAAWTTYRQGLYLPYIAWAQQGVDNMSSSGLSCQPVQTTSTQADVQIAQTGPVVQEATPPGLPATFDSYPGGQCTYWVALHFPVPPSLGNAADWYANAAARGLQETETPTVGSVAVYAAGNGYSSLGHVAYVVAVSGNTFTVSEMNYLGVWMVDERTSSLSDVEGFIL